MGFDSSKYVPTIDAILSVSDLAVISSKRIRRSLQELLKVDLTPYKKELDAVIVERFLLVQEKKDKVTTSESPTNSTSPSISSSPKTNHIQSSNRSTTVSSTKVSKQDTAPSKPTPQPPPPSKSKPKPKPIKDSKSTVDKDAELAAKLQAELNRPSLRESRNSTRKSRKKKSTKRVTDDGDSDPTDDKPKKRKISANNPFMRPVILSPALSAILGQTEMPRPHVVKALWEYIKANELQNPQNKLEIVCDDKLRPIFGAKTTAFSMNKLLSPHLSKKEETVPVS